jgi:hypothetical protein
MVIHHNNLDFTKPTAVNFCRDVACHVSTYIITLFHVEHFYLPNYDCISKIPN